MPPEVGLLSNVLEHNKFTLSQYGQLVHDSIETEQNHNWVATFLASNYWRILGMYIKTISLTILNISTSLHRYEVKVILVTFQ